MPGINQSGEVVTIPPYILPASSAGAWECVVNWPVVFQCGGVGFVTVQRRCRLTYLFPAGATQRRPAEPLPAQSPPPPARRDPIGAAADGAAGTEEIPSSPVGVLVGTWATRPMHRFHGQRPGQCSWSRRPTRRRPPPRRAAASRRATASRRHVPCPAPRHTYLGVRAVAPSDPLHTLWPVWS